MMTNTDPVNNLLEEKIKALEKELADLKRQKSVEVENAGYERYYNYFQLSHEAIYCTEFDNPIDISLPLEQQIDEIYKNAFLGECNLAMAKMYGFSNPSDFIGKRLIEFHNGSDNPVNRETFRKFILNGYKSINNQTEEINLDGESLFFISNDFGVIKNNKLIRIWGSSINITESKRKENELLHAKNIAEENETKYRAAFYTSPDSVNITKLNGEYVEVSEGFTRVTGYTPAEAIGKKSTDLNIWAIPADRLRLVNELKENGIVENLESVFRAKDGTLIPGLMSAKFITLRNEPHILSVTKVITERKKFEQELIIAKEKAEESDRLKSAFLKNISHEIRTPMNAICGFSDLLLKFDLPREKHVQFIQIVQKSINQLLNVIENIITISHIETNQLEINKINFNPATLFSELYQHFLQAKSHIEKSHIGLNTIIPEKNDSILFSDYTKLKQILTILLDNAFKFTNTGKIEFGYIINSDRINFFVEDTGIGIPKDKQDIIFKSFMHADDTIRQLFGGVGLGLSIAVGLIKLINGELFIKSEENKGTRIEFYLPIELSEKNNYPEINRKNISETILLVAEDEEYNFMYIEELLSDTKIKIMHAYNGRDAVTMCKNIQPDIILMDLKMPFMDGIEATKLIREFDTKVPIIAQTAYSYKREFCLNSGFTNYITKPFNKEQLFSVLMLYLKTE